MHCAFNVATVERDRGGRDNEACDAGRRQCTKVESRLHPRREQGLSVDMRGGLPNDEGAFDRSMMVRCQKEIGAEVGSTSSTRRGEGGREGINGRIPIPGSEPPWIIG